MKLKPEEQAFLSAICKLTQERHYYAPHRARILHHRDHLRRLRLWGGPHP